jgi:hypothetical protein
VTAGMVRPAAVNSGSRSGSASGSIVRGLAGLEAAAFVCCGVCVPPSSVSMPAGVSRPGAGAPSGALARTSPSTAPPAPTRPASSPGNCPAAAVPAAPGVASAGSRDAVPGARPHFSHSGKSRASSDAGAGRAATPWELQPEGQTQPAAFSRICAPTVRQKTVRHAISAKILARNSPLPYPPLRQDSLSFEKVVSLSRGWHSPCFFLPAWTP